MFLMSPLLTWQQLSIEVFHDSFETDPHWLQFSFSYITGVHHIFAFKTFDIAKKKGFLEKTTEK